MKLGPRVLLAWLLLALLVVTPWLTSAGQASGLVPEVQNQEDPARQKAIDFMARMTPEEKVGQLFLVTLPGSTFDDNSQVYDLIANHHVGGIVLLRSNDNFSDSENTLTSVSKLTNALQDAEWRASQQTIASPTNGISFNPQYVPLLIGISQEGNSFPSDQILNGVTQLPSLMSIGATWDPELAQQVGEVMGSELSDLGFNLYLGPSLDVLDVPHIEGGDDMGVRTFGGDPYWVSKLGQAYISGLHQGSENRLAVIAKHFPGRGSSDRSPEEEIATVRKSLAQLQQYELAPFFAVTGNAPSSQASTDGLLVSHIRYQGFQGNIRATTKPVSLDKTALDLIFKRSGTFRLA